MERSAMILPLMPLVAPSIAPKKTLEIHDKKGSRGNKGNIYQVKGKDFKIYI